MVRVKGLMEHIISFCESSMQILDELSLGETKGVFIEYIEILKSDNIPEIDMTNACFQSLYDELFRKYPSHYYAIAGYEDNLKQLENRYACSSEKKIKINPGTKFMDQTFILNQDIIFHNLGNPHLSFEAAAYLIGYAIIAEYETMGQMARTVLSSRVQSYKGIKPWEMEFVIQSFFSLNYRDSYQNNMRSDYRSEICHIRNGFAHSHIKFQKHKYVEIWDFTKDSNNQMVESFHETFSIEELLDIYRSFGQRTDLGILYFTFDFYVTLLYGILKGQIDNDRNQ